MESGRIMTEVIALSIVTIWLQKCSEYYIKCNLFLIFFIIY